jgi:hypothetical protein
MAERRTLSTAINSVPNADPDAVRAFVTQERTTQTAPQNAPNANNAVRSNIMSSSVNSERSNVNAAERTEEHSPAPVVPQRPVAPAFQPVGLIPITVRLRPEIAGALKRASLERQLDAAEFFSQQEIVERSLTAWLRKNGHLSS